MDALGSERRGTASHLLLHRFHDSTKDVKAKGRQSLVPPFGSAEASNALFDLWGILEEEEEDDDSSRHILRNIQGTSKKASLYVRKGAANNRGYFLTVHLLD